MIMLITFSAKDLSEFTMEGSRNIENPSFV